MFTKQGTLMQNAVPKRILDTSPNKEQSPKSRRGSDEVGFSDEVIACRACLAADGRLYAISGSGFEDALAALTGIALPSEENLPRHLCTFCLAKLSKYAAFHEGCQRSTAVLQALLERGPLNMNVIKAHSKKSQEQMNNLSLKRVFQFGTAPVIEIKPLVMPQNVCSQEDPEYTEIEYLESEDFIDDAMDVESLSFESPLTLEASKIINVMEKTKYTKTTISKTIKEVTPEDTVATLKTDTELAFEKEFNFEITMLSREEQKQKVEDRKRNRSSAYSCDLCGKEYVDENTLIKHKKYYHDPSSPLECDVCFHRFRSLQNLRTHRLSRHRAVFTCKECGDVCRNRINAKDHYFMHQGRTYTCPHCLMKYVRQSSFYAHMRLQHPGESEPCDECGETFTGNVGLLVHKRMQHWPNDKPNKDFKCSVCEVTFLSADALQRHAELSVGVAHAALWPCAACGDTCGSEVALAAHAVEKHPPDQHYCKKCDKTFSNAASFALHADRKHKNRRQVKVGYVKNTRSEICEICGKVFNNRTKLQYHRNGHLGLKPFQCPHCPKAFTQQTNLRFHMQVHTGERPYQCEQCPLAFAARGNFTRHIRNVHMRVRVECDKCGKMVGASSLTSHVRAVHLGQPYGRRKRDRTKKPVRVTES